MLVLRTISIMALCAVLGRGWVAAAPSGDPVKDQLEQAKAVRADARAKARAALIQAIDAQIKAASSAGDLDALKLITSQKDAFVAAGVVPNAPALKDAAAQYTLSMHKADGQLVEAYEAAIEAYTTASKPQEALAVRQERHALLEGTADLPAPDSPEAIGFLMEHAKSDYLQSVGDAKKAYLQAIDARITAATNAGDLKAVTSLQAARVAAEADAPLPEGFNDAAVFSARTHYGLAVQAANQKLAGAYRDAIRNYTRARAIDKAQATQAELDATGLASAPAAAAGSGGGAGVGPSSDNSAKLSRILPPYLEATGAFSADKEGIRPAKDVTIATRAADFLTKDFVFDVHVQVPKEGEWVVVGIGDKTEKGSMRVVIRDDGGWGRRAFLTHGDTWGQHIGDIHVSELYVVRLERHGGPVTASVGSVTDGKFTADMSQTVSDVKAFVPDIAEKRSHLFFTGAVLFTQVRLATGAAAASSGSAGEHSPMTPVKLPGSGAAGAQGGSAPAAGSPASPLLPGAGAADTDAAAGIYHLTSDKLPAPFEATGTYSVSAAGLKPYDNNCLIITKAEDFLSKDFVFEAAVDVPRKEDWIIMGLGDGTEKGSLRLIIRPDAGWGTRAFITRGDQWGKNFGDIRESGPRVLRIEHHGTAVTVAVGTSRNGKFDPEMSQTVADAKADVAELSDRRAHLFFTGKTNWSQVRLVTGDTPVSAPGAVSPGALAPAPAPGSARTVNLLSLVVPGRDSVRGKWVMTKDGLQSDSTKEAGLQFPYHPPAEYDLTVTFTPHVHKDCVNVVAVLNGHQFQLNLASSNTWGGIDSVKSKRAFDPANPTRTPVSFEANHEYTLVLHVRKTAVAAELDGKPIIEYKTDGSDLSLFGKWKLHDNNAIGIQSNETPTVFHTVEVKELGG